MIAEVHLHTHGHAGHISLARPKALHALTQGMCEAMSSNTYEYPRVSIS